jgi:hypothetical protein
MLVSQNDFVKEVIKLGVCYESAYDAFRNGPYERGVKVRCNNRMSVIGL